MSLAIFDLDNTLIGGDSDVLWGEFLVERGFVDGDYYQAQNEEYYRQYQDSTLNIEEYLAFALQPLAQFQEEQLCALHQDFMTDKIAPIFLPKAQALVDKHRQSGATLLIITATNDFITTPIAQALNIDNLLASQAEKLNGLYTGRATGIPCFQQGKVTRLQQWLADCGETLEDSYFYSDSINDLPLLNLVDHPVAVDPDSRLQQYAVKQGFPVISLR